MNLNLSIDSNLIVKIQKYYKVHEFQMTKESLLKLYNALDELDKIPENRQEETLEEHSNNEKIRNIFQKHWRDCKMLRMNDKEMKAYQIIFVTEIEDFNLYISKVSVSSINALIFKFLGNSSKNFSIFDVEFEKNGSIEKVAETIRYSIASALK